jgi:hypothetical protein
MSDATAFTDYRDRKKLSQQGKSAESLVKKYCEREAERRGIAFHWERIPDARAAGGRFTPVAGDFRMGYGGRYAVVEVKETTAIHKLPKKNYSRDAIARLYKHHLSGAVTAVLVRHMPLDVWVVMPIKHIFDADTPSWSTLEFPHFESADIALDFALRALLNS